MVYIVFTRIQLVRTERINLKHQDFLFYLLFEKGQNNPANYLSWHVNQWKSVSKSERERSKDLSKLLHTLPVTTVLDALGIRETAEHTQTNTKLS